MEELNVHYNQAPKRVNIVNMFLLFSQWHRWLKKIMCFKDTRIAEFAKCAEICVYQSLVRTVNCEKWLEISLLTILFTTSPDTDQHQTKMETLDENKWWNIHLSPVIHCILIMDKKPQVWSKLKHYALDILNPSVWIWDLV